MTKNNNWRPVGLALAAVVAALSLLAAGCGGSGESEATAAGTKAQFIKAGDKICDKANVAQEKRLKVQAKKIYGEGGSRITDEQRITFAGLPPLRQEVKELSELEPTNDPRAEGVVSALEKAIQETEADPLSLEKKPSPFAKAEEQARAYGFVICGTP